MPTSVALYPHFTTTRTATDIRTVEELLGHQDVRTTVIYLHVMKKSLY